MANMPHAPAVLLPLVPCDDRVRNEGAWMKAATGVRAIAMLAFIAVARFADAAEIRVYSTGAPAEAAKSVAASFAIATGHHLTFTVGQPATIESDLAAGDKADVVILPAPVVAMMNNSGAWRAGSAV